MPEKPTYEELEQRVLELEKVVSKRKQTEHALRESESLLSSVFRAAPTGIGVVSNRILLAVNDRVCDMIGYSREEMIGQSARMLYPSDAQFEYVGTEKYRQILQCGTGTVETQWRCKDGRILDILMSSTPINPMDLDAGVTFTALDITERKKAEHALQESEKKYRLIAEHTADLISILDMNLHFTYVSPAIMRLRGFTVEEAIGQTLKRVLTPESIRLALAVFEQEILLEASGTADPKRMRILELEMYKKDGSVVWVEVNFSFLRDKDRKPVEILTVSRDITDRKLTEEALRESEALQRILLNNLPAGVIIVDPVTRVIERVNEQVASMFGAPVDHLMGHRCHALLCPANEGACPVCDLGNTIDNSEREMLRKDGSRLPILKTVKRIHLKGQEKLLECFVDMSERKRAEMELLENRKRLADIVNFLPDATLAIDKEKRVIIWNKAIEEMTSVPAAEIIGKGDYAYTVPFYGEARPQLMDLIFMDHEDIEARYPKIAREGDCLTAEVFCNALYENKGAWIFAKASPLYDQFGNIVGAIESIRDITERKRAEAEREKLQVQLNQAQKMESVGRLAGGVAHDFNNMLQSITGHAEMALDKIDPTHSLHGNLSEILKAAQRSADLTRQLLAFARKQTISPVALDLNETISGMLKMLHRLIGENIDFSWKPALRLWPVRVDPSQIDQIMVNLCVNARDAISGVGSVTIETENVCLDQTYRENHVGFIPGEYVLVAVSDTGTGIGKDMLEQIFEPFFTTKELGKGSGLGLSTVYGIVKQNNGFIYVYSEPAKGATFKIYLPRFVGEVMKSTGEGSEEFPLSRGETVLLVEDEPMILDVSREMLERLGYEVLTADTPSDALHLAKTHSGEICLLITDVVMPEMNGKDLSKLICDIKPGLKCLFISGYTANVIAHHGVLDEGVHFIQKPFSIKNLAVKVREVLDNTKLST
jgi:two-component system cell cycle sensor histidine kinase/response regulator CckA